jgi:hypothetical protein
MSPKRSTVRPSSNSKKLVYAPSSGITVNGAMSFDAIHGRVV